MTADLTCGSCHAANPSMAMFCMYCGGSLTQVREPSRLRLVTVVFCDISGSTQLAQRFDPQVWHGILEAYFAEVGGALTAAGGRLEKFIGDAVVGVFGADLAGEDDAVRAVEGAFAGLERLATRNAELLARYGLRLSVRYGIASGRAVTTDRESSFAIGTVMNRAARLQGAAPVDGVVVDVRTWLLVRDRVRCEAVPPVAAKGFDRPLRAWVTTPRGAADETQGAFVNQTDLMGRLRRDVRAATGRDGVTVLALRGGMGSGKSRVLDRLADELARRPGLRTVRLACRPDDREHEAARLEQLRRELAGPRAPRRGGSAVPSVRELVWRVGGTLAALSRDEGPVVVLVDDFPYASPAFRELLRPPPGDGGPRVFVLAGRDAADDEGAEGEGDWGADRTYRVPPLTDADAQTLLEVVGGDIALHSAMTAEPLVRRGGGNPLFLEQLAALAGDGIVDEIAPSAEAALGARIEPLSASARHVLACLGAGERAVAPGDLDAVCDLREAELDAALEELDAAGLIGNHVAAEVAYAQMVLGDRAKVHVAIAEGMLRAVQDDPTVLDLAVLHAVRGQGFWREFDPVSAGARAAGELAARSLVAAARQAIARSEVARAVELCGRARELAGADEALTLEIAALDTYALVATGRPDEALERIAAVSGLRGNVSAAFHLLVTETVVRDRESPRLRALARTVDDPTALARLDTWDGLRAARAGDYRRAEELLESAYGRMRRFGMGLGTAEIYGNLSLFLVYGDTPVAGALERCLALREEVSDAPLLHAVVSCSAAMLVQLSGDAEGARAMAAEAYAVFDGMGHEPGRAGALEFGGQVAELAGDLPGAARFARAAGAVYEALGADRTAVLCAMRAYVLDGGEPPRRLLDAEDSWETRVLRHQYAALTAHDGGGGESGDAEEAGRRLDLALEEIGRIRGDGVRLLPLLGCLRIAGRIGDEVRSRRVRRAVEEAWRRREAGSGGGRFPGDRWGTRGA
ncbi:adenylate/guanylate cyclase domain-containing protein [Streptomyces avicenniae]|uniref:adenylate/guanylate cyclase domain-containing protein n=1 Tax=Streptomyces avicenniae TaxID=500153 RepID=UPI00167C6C2B|nr:adenylate/guanylate cyclase domain-containing protein [Streptomyces avicenniae]